MNPQEGQSLSGTDVTPFQWFHYDGEIHPEPILLPYNFPGVTLESGNLQWTSKPLDVRGRPDFSIQINVTNIYENEGDFLIGIQTSIDGVNWLDIPLDAFTPDLTDYDNIGNGESWFLSIFLRTNFVRIVITADESAFGDGWQIAAILIAGEA